MAYENLLYEKKEGIAYITFNRPKVLNALNRQTIEEFHRVLLDVKHDPAVRVMILTGSGSIRDVIAFPKTAKGTCLMTESPAAVDPKQLRELHLELKAAKAP